MQIQSVLVPLMLKLTLATAAPMAEADAAYTYSISLYSKSDYNGEQLTFERESVPYLQPLPHVRQFRSFSSLTLA